jgi:hypothetical protein
VSRPELAIVGSEGSGPTPEEAAAAIAAVEQFLRDHAPVAVAAAPRLSPWKTTALSEGVRRAPDASPFWA